MDKHLWEVDHPYYASQGNYYAVGWHTSYESWEEFISGEGDNDDDLNLVYRWDWEIPDPEDYDVESGEVVPPETFDIFYVLQRKAVCRSVSVAVRREDEPAIREWLAGRAAHMRLLWEPLDMAAEGV